MVPRANPRMVGDLERCDAIVYGCGSLFTSIAPCVTLDGVGEAIAARQVPKVCVHVCVLCVCVCVSVCVCCRCWHWRWCVVVGGECGCECGRVGQRGRYAVQLRLPLFHSSGQAADVRSSSRALHTC